MEVSDIDEQYGQQLRQMHPKKLPFPRLQLNLLAQETVFLRSFWHRYNEKSKKFARTYHA
jgi:hypothetical protein